MHAYPSAAPTIHPIVAATGTDSPKRLNRKGPFGATIHTPIIMPRHPTSNVLTCDPLITFLMMQARGTAVYKQGLTAFRPLRQSPTAEIFPLLLGSGALGSRRLPASPPRARHAKGETKRSALSVSGHSSRATFNKPDLPCRSVTRLRTRSANPLSFDVQPPNPPEQLVVATVPESDGPAAHGARERI